MLIVISVVLSPVATMPMAVVPTVPILTHFDAESTQRACGKPVDDLPDTNKFCETCSLEAEPKLGSNAVIKMISWWSGRSIAKIKEDGKFGLVVGPSSGGSLRPYVGTKTDDLARSFQWRA
jgi:hypothetical protein